MSHRYHLAILTGTYNRLDLLKRFVTSVRNAIPRGVTYYICIADGGSTDGTLDYLRVQPDVRLIEQGKLIGGIKAYTEAGKTITDARYVLIANDDIEIFRGSITRAFVHLESKPTCGGAAFYTDQPIEGRPQGSFNVQYHPTIDQRGVKAYAPYAQVGLFPTWLAHDCGWWGGDDTNYGAYHYGADNYLSAQIQSRGYTIDALEGCRYHDHLPPDALRTINTERHRDDAERFWSLFPNGAIIPDTQMVNAPPEYARLLRVLYLPIYEPEHIHQYETKRGMRDALSERFLVYEFPYTLIDVGQQIAQKRRDSVVRELIDVLSTWKPDLVLSQIHDTFLFDDKALSAIRASHPSALWVNWNGDTWEKGLISPPSLDMLKYVDLQLTVNTSVLPVYDANKITAAYWQIGYESPVGLANMSIVKPLDVVFLGNNYSKERRALYDALSELPRVGFYGQQWPKSLGETLYDFATGEAILKNAKIAIGDNQFPDAHGFVSNRLFQTLGAGGAILLQQRVEGLDELTGLQAGVHYVEWSDFDDLLQKIARWLSPAKDKARKTMAQKARAEILANHTFQKRIDELFAIIKALKKQTGRGVRLKYVFPHGNPHDFGVRTPIRTLRYLPDMPIAVTHEEAQYLLKQDSNWKVIE